MNQITKDQWDRYDRNGYLNLGSLLDDAALEELQNEIDAIMMGTAPVVYHKIMTQLDSTTGKTKDVVTQSLGSKGKTLNDRKIQNLENDPHFRDYLQRPIFREAFTRDNRSNTTFPIAFASQSN